MTAALRLGVTFLQYRDDTLGTCPVLALRELWGLHESISTTHLAHRQQMYDYSIHPSYGKQGTTYRIHAERPSHCVWPAGAWAAGPSAPVLDVKDDDGPSGPCLDESHRCQHSYKGLWVGEENGWLRVITIYRNRHDLSVFPELQGPFWGSTQGVRSGCRRGDFNTFLLHI